MLLCGGNLDLLEPGKLRGLWGEEDFEQAAAKNEVNDADWVEQMQNLRNAYGVPC